MDVFLLVFLNEIEDQSFDKVLHGDPGVRNVALQRAVNRLADASLYTLGLFPAVALAAFPVVLGEVVKQQLFRISAEPYAVLIAVINLAVERLVISGVQRPDNLNHVCHRDVALDTEALYRVLGLDFWLAIGYNSIGVVGSYTVFLRLDVLALVSRFFVLHHSLSFTALLWA